MKPGPKTIVLFGIAFVIVKLAQTEDWRGWAAAIAIFSLVSFYLKEE